MIIALIIIGILFVLYLLYLYLNNQLFIVKGLNIKIEESINELENQKQKNLDLLTKLSKKINKNSNKKILQDLSKLKNNNLDMFEFENRLYDLNKELNEFIEDNEYVFDDKNNNIFRTFENGLIASKAIKLYYNSQVERYNKLIKSIRFLFIKFIKHLKKKKLFEFRNEVEFEILKK